MAGCRAGDDDQSNVMIPGTETIDVLSVATPIRTGKPTRENPVTKEGSIALQESTALAMSSTAQPTVTQSGLQKNQAVPRAASSTTIIVDHRAVDLFDSIPEQYLQAAAALRMFYMDASVGGNINDGLDCLNYPSDEASPIGCRRLDHRDPTFSVSPSEIDWSHPGGYDRSNWDFQYWVVPGCGGWYDKVRCFFDVMDSTIGLYDVVSFQFSYLEVKSRETIADQPGGFFWDSPVLRDVYNLEAYEAQHPEKTFIYWTTSLARSIGTSEAEAFNQQMRQYASENDKILFDVADILSHDPSGNTCYDNRDGVPYDNGNRSENFPDDGQAYLAICPHYTTEVNGGHLGSVSAGKIRVAKAFWVLMARIAGWN